MRSDIVPGSIFPDYELPDHTGKVQKLSELQGDDPLILTLARGHYCPKEHQQHLELAAFYPKIAVAYTQIATIATDDHCGSSAVSISASWLMHPSRENRCLLSCGSGCVPRHTRPGTLLVTSGRRTPRRRRRSRPLRNPSPRMRDRSVPPTR